MISSPEDFFSKTTL